MKDNIFLSEGERMFLWTNYFKIGEKTKFGDIISHIEIRLNQQFTDKLEKVKQKTAQSILNDIVKYKKDLDKIGWEDNRITLVFNSIREHIKKKWGVE